MLMKLYRVVYKELSQDTFTFEFHCMAENYEHAVEQCRDAYPDCLPRHVSVLDDTPPNIRFWVHANEGLCKLTLKPGQTLSHRQGGPTDEGWSWCGQTWEYDEHEGLVKHSITTEAQDCDGRHGDYRDFECRIEHLAVYQATLWDDLLGQPVEVPGVRLPKWEKAGASQYDQYAEMAGY